MSRWFLSLALLYLIGASNALGVALVRDAPRQPLQQAIQYYEDTSASLTLEQVLQQALPWQANGERVLNKGYSNSRWWLKLELDNPTSKTQQRYIEISYAPLDYVNVYVMDGGNLLAEFHMGDRRLYRERPLDSPNFVFPVEWQPEQNLTLYLEVHSEGAMQVPMVMWKQKAYFEHQMRLETVQGLYWGGMLIIVLYNGLLFISLRDSTYFWYVGSVLFMALMFTTLSGQAYRYLWPNAIQWNNVALLFMICLACIFAGQFSKEFLRLKTLMPRMNKLMSGIMGLCAAIAAVSWWGPYHILVQVVVGVTIVLASMAFAIGVYQVYLGDRSARWYLLAWSVFLLGVIVITLNKTNLLPANFLTNNAAQIGSILEVVLLSFALADRINREKLLRFAAQQALLQTTEKMKEDLEERVQARTQDLEALNLQLEQLSQTDQLTGLKNRRYLELKIEEEFNRCARYNHVISVLMIDVDHFKSVNDQYGHAGGDECLRTIASHLIGGVRQPPDVAARFGGEEFCLLLPETGSKGATVVAERIRQSIHGSVISGDEAMFSVSISVGVYTQTGGDYNGEQALKNADAALYQAKEAGRNRVVVYGIT